MWWLGYEWGGGVYLTIVGDAFKRLLEQLLPVQIQAMEPWWHAALFECLCVLMSILSLHGREPGRGEVREVLAVSSITAELLF